MICFRFCVLAVLVLGASAFPDGAPIDACVKPRTNQPNHGRARSQAPESSPYQILASGNVYGPGSQIQGINLLSFVF